MFTGIVQGTAPIHSITEKANFRTQVVKLPPDSFAFLGQANEAPET